MGKGYPAKNPKCTSNRKKACGFFFPCEANEFCSPDRWGKKMCHCQYGYCVNATTGHCAPAPNGVTPTCKVWPGGRCRFLGCNSAFGPVRCTGGYCLCNLGSCVGGNG